MKSAAQELQEAAMACLTEFPGLGVYPGPPLQATFPYAIVDAGPETDWSHKSGVGREVRLAVMLRDKGERPARLGASMRAAEEALHDLSLGTENWKLVTMQFVRTRLIPNGRGAWLGSIEFRARMLAVG